MRGLFLRLHRERRRFAVVATLTFVGGLRAFPGLDRTLFGLPVQLVAGIAFMFGLTGALAGVVLLIPPLRSHAESVALGIPVLSLMGGFAPDNTEATASLTFILALAFVALVGTVYGGMWLDFLVPRRSGTYRATSTSRLSPEALWPYIAVTPDSPACFRDEITIAMDWIEPGKRFREVARFGDAATIEEVQTIIAVEPPRLLQFHFQAAQAPDSPGHRGIYTYLLTRTDQGTLLQTVRQYDRDSWRSALFQWIDDACGRLDDKKIRSFEAREKADGT